MRRLYAHHHGLTIPLPQTSWLRIGLLGAARWRWLRCPLWQTLIDDLVDMKPVWQSEAQDIPGNCWHGGRHGVRLPYRRGWESLLSYQRGSGDIFATSVNNSAIKRWKQSGKDALIRECQAVAAEFHVLCIDAATGKTLWDVVVDTGPNMYERRKHPGMHHSPRLLRRQGLRPEHAWACVLPQP